MDHKLESLEDTFLLLGRVPSILALDLVVFISSILINVLGKT